MHKSFHTVGQIQREVFPLEHRGDGITMTMETANGFMSITREQAKAFFGLVEPSKAARPLVAAIERELADA